VGLGVCLQFNLPKHHRRGAKYSPQGFFTRSKPGLSCFFIPLQPCFCVELAQQLLPEHFIHSFSLSWQIRNRVLLMVFLIYMRLNGKGLLHTKQMLMYNLHNFRHNCLKQVWARKAFYLRVFYSQTLSFALSLSLTLYLDVSTHDTTIIANFSMYRLLKQRAGQSLQNVKVAILFFWSFWKAFFGWTLSTVYCTGQLCWSGRAKIKMSNIKCHPLKIQIET
jgi:hypothetical protein